MDGITVQASVHVARSCGLSSCPCSTPTHERYFSLTPAFAIPAKGRNDEAAYAWINFNLRPDIAAKVAAATGNVTASLGADQLMDAKFKAQFAASFPRGALNNIKWYPALPAGLEEIEGRVLERVKGGG